VSKKQFPTVYYNANMWVAQMNEYCSYIALTVSAGMKYD